MLGDYTTYTPALDRRNGDALSSRAGPERVLRHAGFYTAVFYPPYSGPTSARVMLCNFEALRTTGRYQVLGRVRDRCGRPRLIGSRQARYGREVSVPTAPRPGEVVLARVRGLEPAAIERVRTLLYRSAARSLTLDGRPAYRIYPDASDDLILAAPDDVDFPHPFGLAPDPKTIGFTRAPGLGVWGGDKLTIDFYALSVRPARRPVRTIG